MRTLAQLAAHWVRQSALGKGLRIEATDLDLLNAIGVGELIAKAAANEQKTRSADRIVARRDPPEN